MTVLSSGNQALGVGQVKTADSAHYAVAFSRGIRRIRNIERFLDVIKVVSPEMAYLGKLPVSCVVVWGRKQNSRKAIRYAVSRTIPVYFIEDGWIRSCAPDAHSRVCYSLLLDNEGVYYDCRTPSSLERYLNLPDEQFESVCGSAELAYASECRKILISANITKYNFCAQPSPDVLNRDDRSLVLVLDQTLDDASVQFGGMDSAAFEAMLDRAIEENPNARVVVRTHPDVVAGRKKGYLQFRALTLGVEISAEGDNPIPWLKQANTVYAGTSQLGYEALLCGCAVKVAGLPFYAGWGLTVDFQQIDRRKRCRSLDQLFHATHVHHARYRCPLSGARWDLRECLEHVILQQSYFDRNRGNKVCINIKPWKRRMLKHYLRSPHGKLRFSSSHDIADHEVALHWSFTDISDNAILDARCGQMSGTSFSSDQPCIRIEDGFIRSRGLGSDFVLPGSLVFDELGLYFDANNPSSLEALLNDFVCSPTDILRAKSLRASILSAQLTKYNLAEKFSNSHTVDAIRGERKVILAIGQVEGDQSMLRGSGEISSNTALLRAVREANPDAFIIFKPHPDVVCGNRKGVVNDEVLSEVVDYTESKRHFIDCLNDCDELHTITSLSGFEAVLREKPVVTYGMPFYAGWGVTTDRLSCPRRRTNRTVDEMVFLCLAVYPHYLDLDSGEFMTVEQMVAKMRIEKPKQAAMKGLRWIEKLDNVREAMTYRP